jgi:Fe-S cluster biosynthesis and repair protein YggX
VSAATIACARCGREGEALAGPPLPGPFGEEIARRICADCWAEWQRVEVMVINELRLNFMDPASQDLLIAEMRQFLGLDGAPRAGGAGSPTSE